MIKKFAFDMDGTITKAETLPIIAAELGLAEEMQILTDLTLSGQISFEKSFKLRYLVLRNIPLKKIREIMAAVELDEDIAEFIRANKRICAVVTGNLDCWIEPIVDKLGCEIYSSTSEIDDKNIPVLKKILDKGAAIRELKKSCDKVIAVGESFNDIPMFEAADVAIAYGGVHKPISAARARSNYFATDGKSLCRLLNMIKEENFMEKTLVLIKPDAFGKNHAGDILKLYEDAGFKILAAKVMRMTESLAAKHYVEHIGRPYYPALVEFMTSAPIMAVVLGGDDVIKKVREINGATNPAEAAEGTVRKLYAEDKTKNAVHASDSPESSAREIPIFFSAAEIFD